MAMHGLLCPPIGLLPKISILKIFKNEQGNGLIASDGSAFARRLKHIVYCPTQVSFGGKIAIHALHATPSCLSRNIEALHEEATQKPQAADELNGQRTELNASKGQQSNDFSSTQGKPGEKVMREQCSNTQMSRASLEAEPLPQQHIRRLPLGGSS